MTRRRPAWVIAVGVVGVLTVAGIGVALSSDDQPKPGLSQEEMIRHFESINWPEGYTRQDKITALEQRLAEDELTLQEVEGAVARSEPGTFEYERWKRTQRGLENSIAALKKHIDTLRSA